MNFVVIATPRTGSTHLTNLLHLHDDVLCHGEIFHPKRVFVRWPKERKTPDAMAQLLEIRRRDPHAFLQTILAQNGGYVHVGFKIFAGHNDDILEDLIRNPSIRKIVLWRQNMLASYSSSLIAHQTGRGDARPTEFHQPKIEFRAKNFLTYCERVSGFYRSVFERLASARQFSFVVYYEQINDPWLFSNVLSFIGANATGAKTEGRRTKQNSSAMLSRFSNPEKVSEFLQQHEMMGWLHESAVSLGTIRTCATPERDDRP
ncbi:MAG TPA: hypothetical protein VGL35_01400 [Rhizomicrobium sp.]